MNLRVSAVLFLLCGLPASGASTVGHFNRTALFWLEPFANLTSVAAYKDAWEQFGARARPEYVLAGSAYTVDRNGTLVFAKHSTGGQLEHGRLMEAYGFPALRQLRLRTTAMVYLTDPLSIARLFAGDPAPFVAQLLNKAAQHGLAGFDFDFEPAMTFDDDVPAGFGAGLVPFLSAVGAALADAGLLLTVDIGGCSDGKDAAFPCSAHPEGLLQANTMDTFATSSLTSFEQTFNSSANRLLGELWAPGFEPSNMKSDDGAAFKDIAVFMGKRGVRHLSTWEVHEPDAGAQPQWLFDAVDAFLDA